MNQLLRARRRPAVVGLALGIALSLVTGCTSIARQVSAQPAEQGTVPAAPTVTAPSADETYILFNQRMIEGALPTELDITDVDAVFARVFQGLPDEVIVYPSENYYYFVLNADRRQIWGNIRLPAGAREDGELSFGYFEFVEFPWRSGEGLSGSKFYNAEDGVVVEEIDRFTYRVTYQGKEVIFHLYQLEQSPPTHFALGADELFIERTMDESGYQFFLLFNSRDNYFFWVLNEEAPMPDILKPLADDLVVGERSGFAFWLDEAHDNRKVLMAVRRLSVTRNDYYDGPFDQLADNYAAESNISEYMQRAFPALRGRIDTFGYYLDQERPMRVALSTYLNYYAEADLTSLVEQVRASEDPYAFISRRGGSAPSATPQPSN